jgi:hypothetical protein
MKLQESKEIEISLPGHSLLLCNLVYAEMKVNGNENPETQ